MVLGLPKYDDPNPVLAVLRIAISTELCMYPWACPASDLEPSHYLSFLF